MLLMAALELSFKSLKSCNDAKSTQVALAPQQPDRVQAQPVEPYVMLGPFFCWGTPELPQSFAGLSQVLQPAGIVRRRPLAGL